MQRFFQAWRLKHFAVILLLSTFSHAHAEVDQAQFIADAFANHTGTQAQKMWLTGERKDAVTDILGHPYHQLRVSYWTNPVFPTRRVWVLQEIGKDRYIDVGIQIEQRQIQKLRILAFRESRGWEVKLPFFTEQFAGAKLDADQQLSQRIDSISGATLSWRAVTKVARVALYLDQQLESVAP